MRVDNPPKKRNRHEVGVSPLVFTAQRFMKFCETYRDYFSAARHNVSDKARSYLAGLLMRAPRKNMERMEEYVSEYNYQAQQQFLSDSPWDHKPLVSRVGLEVDRLLGGEGSALLIDETAMEKKGRKSVGVSRQWNGRLGKVDNCQVGVFAGLTDGTLCGLIDFRLYLPECWADDAQRCTEAKIPVEEQVYRSKAEFALEMVDAAVARKLRFGWVDVDSGYGHIPWLLRKLDERGLRFIADVHRDQCVYGSDPQPYLPERKEGRGRRFSTLRSQVAGVDVKTLFEQLPDSHWRSIVVRDSTKGALNVLAARQRIWVWEREEPHARQYWAVCVRIVATGETKWFFSNAPETETLTELVRKHAFRFWIERAFQDTKTSLGMADYQVRGWRAWHHHMALCMLAFLFMLQERKVHCKEIELLSCQDIVELLNHYLPRADASEEDVLNNIQRRHLKRRLAIENARRKARTRSKIFQTY